MTACPNCGAAHPTGQKFCGECGAPLLAVCSTCGAENAPGQKFCGECGAALAVPGPAAPAAPPRPPPVAAVAERRLVSVLFADLVGFTALSEGRDAEEVRDLLSQYFDSCRQLITRYGGTVEKFIGDAVMAVWGTPAAQEDDAERAVRAGLELVSMVAALGQQIGEPALRVRAGVLTGEAAVTIGAQAEGMVAGDLVNTASRIQAAAEPGSVFVGEATKRATDAAIAYADAGLHELKGKSEPVLLFRALRVVAGRAGALKSVGLEPSFVGRERELRLVKELFHASAEERKAHLVSVVGIAGIGKSRLGWEFFKYIDGLADVIWWRRGRCLAYGEGVAYWALAEMVRMQAEILEGEEPESAREKLDAAVAELGILDDERHWIVPRLAQLLGLDEQSTHERDDLFAAWRLFFERMAEQGPAVLVFEDLQWADASLLEFIEYLLDWSRKHPLFVLALARPDRASQHSWFGAVGRNVTTLSLEPLSEADMESLLASFVPGLPGALRDQILQRAEGVPLYAVETVRMLLDRGLLVREGEEYRPAGEIGALAVPETLHALIASRLDSLPPEERGLLQSAAVLGKTFTRQALAAVTGMPEPELEPLLQGLVRKEVLFVQADARSPERGQFGFLQDLLKRVAYETLARGERKARHLAAARALETSFGPADPEIVEVLAAHYLAAYEAAPDAADAAAIRARTKELLARAGERAASLAARDEASRYFTRAGEFAEEPLDRARLLERAGMAAWAGGRGATARERFEEAITLYEGEGATHPAARVAALRTEITWAEGHIDQAVEGMEASFSVLSQDAPDEDLAMLAAQLGRLLYFKGDPDRAHSRIERALEIAESLELPEVVSEALDTKAVILSQAYQRPQEASALLAHSLRVALDAGIPHSALRAYYNLACLGYYADELGTAQQHSQEGLAYARRFGDRNWESTILSISVGIHALNGEWDDALSLFSELPDLAELEASAEITSLRFAAVELLTALTPLYVARGLLDEADRLLERFADFRDSSDVQERVAYGAAASVVLGARGAHAEALAAGVAAFGGREGIGPSFFGVKLGFVAACDAAFALGQPEHVDDLLGAVDSLTNGQTTPFLRAQADRMRGRLSAARGDVEQAASAFATAAATLTEVGLPFWLGVVALEHGELLARGDRHDDAQVFLAEAGSLFEQLDALPWLERAARAAPSAAAAAAAVE